VCDVWRIWSQTKGNAAWHEMAIKEIGEFYQNGPVPGLSRIRLNSDGQRAQFKGRKNLGAMAELPHPLLALEVCSTIDCLCMPDDRTCGRHMEPGLGIEVYHDFSASHHGSGPVDNYGKDGRRAMDDDVACGDLIRYNYEHCFDWCTKWMPVTSDKKKHLGTFGANGAYIWRAYSKLGDANPRGFPVVGGG